MAINTQIRRLELFSWVSPTLTTWRQLGPQFAGLILLLQGPLLGLRALLVHKFQIPPQAAEMMFDGGVDLMLMPLIHGTIIFLTHAATKGDPLTVFQGLKKARQIWSKLLVAYVSVSFILLGWLVIFALPGLFLMWLFGIDNLYALVPVAVFGGIFALLPLSFLETLVVINKTSPWQGRQQSRLLAKGHSMVLLTAMLTTELIPQVIDWTLPEVAERFGAWCNAAIFTEKLALAGDSPFEFLTLPVFWEFCGRLINSLLGLVAVVVFFHIYSMIRLLPGPDVQQMPGQSI